MNTTRGVNYDASMTLEHECDVTQDAQSSMTIRNVERGSHITSTSSTNKIILQMLPRGNIEIAHPLALTTPFCVKKLTSQKKKYLVSFKCMRKLKI